jgi:phosphopantetheinyl transferase
MSFQEITISEITAIPNEVELSSNDTIQIYFFVLDNFQSLLPFFSTLLTNDELTRSNGYFHSADATRFVITRAILKILLSRNLNCSSSSITIHTDTHKKPKILEPEFNIHFSVSHTKKHASISINDSYTGIYIE